MALFNKLQTLLFKAGLSEAEVFVYIELLNKPAQLIWELVQRTGFRKSTVYDAFGQLKKLQMVERTKEGIRALSLKALVAELNRSKRQADKTAYQIKQLAPFLRAPRESLEEFETFYTPQQIADAYLTMAQLPYGVNLDFGDYESFITAIADNKLGFTFRAKRAGHASHQAICTTFGSNLAEFCTKEALTSFKNKFDIMQKIDFKNRWIIFSDTNDYVLYNDVTDKEFPTAVLVKSKAIADIERLRFKHFSEMTRN